MTMHARPSRAVKLQVPRLNAGPEANTPALSELKGVLEKLNTSFEEFKAKNDERLSQVESRRGEDVVTREQVDRINADISETTQAIKALNQQIAAGSVLTTPEAQTEAAAKDYANKFRDFVAGRITKEEFGKVTSPRADMSTLSDPDGGVLVPETVETTIGRVQGTTSAMRSISQVLNVSTATYKKLHDLAGTTSGWVGEKESRAKTATPNFSELEFPTHEQYAMPALTGAVIDDASIDLLAYIGGQIAIKFNEDEGSAFVDGDGQKKPRGFLDYTKVANTSWAWGKLGFSISGVAAALSDSNNNGADALIDVVQTLKPAYRANGRWLMNDLTEGKVRKLKNTDGDYLWQPSIQVGEPNMLLGYAVTSDDNMPDVGAGKFPIGFGDFQRGYLILNRTGVRVLIDPYTQKPYTLVYTTRRVGGGVQDFEAIKLLKVAAS